MTARDAIEVIKSECYVVNALNFDRTKIINTALDMAVKALKQEPCEDAISRKDFIAKIEDIYDGYMLDEGGCYPQNFVDLAEEMPSVQPKQRVGLRERTEYSPGLCNYHCSECHNISLDIGNYCPNCGAKMSNAESDL